MAIVSELVWDLDLDNLSDDISSSQCIGEDVFSLQFHMVIYGSVGLLYLMLLVNS